MAALSHIFPCDKSIMLNILYDTLDMLGFHIEQAHSEKGTITALSAGSPIRRMQIACGRDFSGQKTTVQVFSEIDDDTGDRLTRVLMEEITATVKRSLHPDRVE